MSENKILSNNKNFYCMFERRKLVENPDCPYEDYDYILAVYNNEDKLLYTDRHDPNHIPFFFVKDGIDYIFFTHNQSIMNCSTLEIKKNNRENISGMWHHSQIKLSPDYNYIGLVNNYFACNWAGVEFYNSDLKELQSNIHTIIIDVHSDGRIIILEL